MPPLPAYLYDIQRDIEGYAREYGLDTFEQIYELLDYKTMNEVAAYGGFPTRYPHWRFGMDYERLSKGYAYGLQKIYEMVINNDPCYAYLLEGNSLVEQKLVMAHVCAHNDFFKNNYYFSKTNRKMIDEMANHSTRVRRHMERFGVERVESFIDVCLSVDNLIDPMSMFIRREADKRRKVEGQETVEPEQPKVIKLKAKSYMDRFINPPEALEKQLPERPPEPERPPKIPAQPQRDVLQFLLDYAPLEPWQRDVLEIVREEAYYFAPQGMTKIMNEGWATYWHSQIMTRKVLTAAEIIDYADQASSVLAGGRTLNPYKIGVELFRHIEERWNMGRFGKEWEECDDLAAKRAWDRQLGLGKEKIFQVRAIYNDVTFIDEFFTEEFCREQLFYSYGWNERNTQWEIQSREYREIKQKLLGMLTNFGNPFVFVEDGNFENRGELLIRHRHEGTDLRIDWARDTLSNLYRIWRRPVCLLTQFEETGKLLRFDGKDHTERTASNA
ncbi:MAG: SpoVR family protein [Deltaproteobacteria bacterium]|nr:SpoVR family protein [Deltaproteobacteria bacterium]